MNLFSKKINYRPEIDGLKAIAVVAVIFYHAQITIFDYKIFKGGFIGVDIFFIISGYLITLIILKEFYATGNFSFKYFYQRRARRILPLLFFVILISSFFAWKYLLPMHLVDFSKSVFYLLGFSSNFYFHYSVQYGSENALLKPLLHTWSLSVEGQYYILFPAVILIVFKYFKKYFFHIFFLGFFLNIFLNQFSGNLKLSYPYFKNIEDMQFENGSVYFSFYFLTSRVWELIAGSILAYSKINNYGRGSDNKNLNKFLITLGFFLLLHAIFFLMIKCFIRHFIHCHQLLVLV